MLRQVYRSGPGGRDRTLAVKVKKTLENQGFFCKKIVTKKMHLSSSYNIGGNKFSHTGVAPKSSKAKDGEKKRKSG